MFCCPCLDVFLIIRMFRTVPDSAHYTNRWSVYTVASGTTMEIVPTKSSITYTPTWHEAIVAACQTRAGDAIRNVSIAAGAVNRYMTQSP